MQVCMQGDQDVGHYMAQAGEALLETRVRMVVKLCNDGSEGYEALQWQKGSCSKGI